MPVKLNDRERLLTRVIEGLKSTMLMSSRLDVYNPQTFDAGGGHMRTHVVFYREPVKGELVIGSTGRIDQWKIGFYEENRGEGNHVIRDICTGELCNYGNESFNAIVGLSHTDLLTGTKREFYQKVLEAFRRGDEYCYRFGGLSVRDQTATITVREVFGGMGSPSTPFDIELHWKPRTSVKAILAAMVAGGYGTREFSHTVTDDFGDLKRACIPHNGLIGGE